MKKIIVFTFAMSCINIFSSAQIWDWTKPEPNGKEFINANPYLGEETEDAHDVETDASGNVYVLGDFHDSLYLNNIFRESGAGSYLAKYDSTGNLIWYKSIVPAQYMDYSGIKATDLVVNAQGVFITGKYWASFCSFICPTGCTGGINSRSYKIGSYNFTSAYDDFGFFITKINSNGGVVWNKTGTAPICVNGGSYGPGSINYNPLITTDKNNNIIVSFVYGSDRPSILIGGDVIALDGNYINYGSYLVAVKYNANGIFQWSNYAGGVNSSAIYDCNSMVSDNTGAAYFYGWARDSCFFGTQLFRFNDATTATYLAKLSSTGTWQYVKELSNGSQNILEGGKAPAFLTTDNANNVYALVNSAIQNDSANIGGLKIAVGIGLANTFIVKLDKNGNTRWVKRFGMGNANGYASDNANAIYYSGNNLYITGSLRNLWPVPYSFSKLYVPSTACGQGMLNSFVAKADTSADFKWATTFCGAFNNENFGVAVYGNNVYTCGFYTSGVDGLGNLNGTFVSAGQEHNTFIGKLKDQYIRVGAITPTQVIPGCTVTVPFTSTGLTFSAGNTFTAEFSNATGDFTTPTAIGTTTSTGTGSITATIPASLFYSSGYRLRIRSSDTLKTGFNYYAYADTGYKLSLVCPAPSTGFSATNITATSATLNWTAVGCASGYKVQYRVKGTTTWTTAPVIITNTPVINLTGLTVNTIYQWRVATRCRNNGTNSFSAFSSNKQFTTSTFAIAAAVDDLKQTTTGFTVYPNPSKQTAIVIFHTSKTGNSFIEISDITGRVVYHSTIAAVAGANIHNINIGGFAQGVYLITLTQAGYSRQTIKLNKE